MPQNIADDVSISDAVRRIMQTKVRVESQRELATLVLEELRKDNPDVRASVTRIRRVAVVSGAAKLEIVYRETDRKDLPDICPVCGNGMSPIINNTLDGDRVEVKRNCTVCPYTIGKNVLVPGKYSFVRIASKEVSEEEERLRKLKKAASMLRGANKLIAEALAGTNFPQRAEYSKEMIDEILTSKTMAGSIPNLEADIRGEGHSDPLWTKSLSTPKYPNRKDI